MSCFNKKGKKIRGKSHRLVYIYNKIIIFHLLTYFSVIAFSTAG